MKKRGIGMACLVHPNSVRYYYDSEGSACIVKVHDDGSATVMSGVAEIGQGALTVMAQIVAEELGIHYEDVKVVTGLGTYEIPDDMGAYASRSTFIAGRAAQAAAADAKQKLFQYVAKMLEVKPEDLEAKDRKIYVKGSPERSVGFTEAVLHYLYDPKYTGHTLFLMGQSSVDVEGSEVPTRETGYGNAFMGTIFATHVAEVEVDTEIGEVQIIRHSAAVDCGKAINPMAVEGQIEGAISHGIGYTLLEHMIWEDGKTLNPSYLDYHIPTVFDAPEVTTILVEEANPQGPFGAKGAGEAAMVPVAACINNAIYNAVGVRFNELPITPEKVLKALKEKEEKDRAKKEES